MAYLLDTHTFLWFLEGSNELSIPAKQAIEDRSEFKYVSIISFWEIAIKLSLKKLDLAVPEKELKIHAIKNGFEILPLSFDHTSGVIDLPLHHRDPFDRMIISQAITENLTIILGINIFQVIRLKYFGNSCRLKGDLKAVQYLKERDFLETKKWFDRAMKKSHRTTKLENNLEY